MAGKSEFSKTMRIDLIPSAPTEPVPGRRKRVVIAAPSGEAGRGFSQPAEGGRLSDYHELLESIYDAAIIAKRDGQIVDVNARAVDFLRYERRDLHGMNIVDIISGADESLVRSISTNLENERFTLIQAYCIRRDDSLFPAEIAVNTVDIEDAHLCFFVRDITVRRQFEEMLRTEHNAIQNAGNGIAVADLSARLEYANPAFARMAGYGNAEDLPGVDLRRLLKDPKRVAVLLDAVMGASQPWTDDAVAVRRDGTEFDVQISAACNRNSDGEAVGIVLSFIDIGDRKRAEEAEREAERHRVMLESLGAACHHLGQPATVLLANLGIVQKRLADRDPDTAELVRGSIAAAESLGEILHKLNAVTEYRTTRYIDRIAEDGRENRILDI